MIFDRFKIFEQKKCPVSLCLHNLAVPNEPAPMIPRKLKCVILDVDQLIDRFGISL